MLTQSYLTKTKKNALISEVIRELIWQSSHVVPTMRLVLEKAVQV